MFLWWSAVVQSKLLFDCSSTIVSSPQLRTEGNDPIIDFIQISCCFLDEGGEIKTRFDIDLMGSNASASIVDSAFRLTKTLLEFIVDSESCCCFILVVGGGVVTSMF